MKKAKRDKLYQAFAIAVKTTMRAWSTPGKGFKEYWEYAQERFELFLKELKKAKK